MLVVSVNLYVVKNVSQEETVPLLYWRHGYNNNIFKQHQRTLIYFLAVLRFAAFQNVASHLRYI